MNLALGILQGLQLKFLMLTKELVAGKCLQNTVLFPLTPAFLGRSLKSGYVSTSACHELTCSVIPPGRVPVLLWIHEYESIQVASHTEFKRAVKEHGRTFSASSVVTVKQLA